MPDGQNSGEILGAANSAKNSAKNKKRVRGNPNKIVPYKFKPGQSGNPSGRPRKPMTEALMRRADELVPGDKQERTFAQKAADEQWVKAAKGDTKSFEVICDRLDGKVQSGELVASMTTTNVTILNADKAAELGTLLERLSDLRAARSLERG